MQRIPSRGADQFMVRFPDGMREKIKSLAEQGMRSMNSEIIFRISRDMENEASSGASDTSGGDTVGA